MKLLSRVGSIAALGVVALLTVGASQAFAVETTLCKINENPCVAGNRYAAGAFKWSATNTELLTAPGNIVCTKARFTNTTGAAMGEPLTGEINPMTIESCTWKGLPCSIATNPAWKTEIAVGTAPDGTMKIVEKAGVGEPRLAFSCNAGIYKCVYSAETTVTVHGGGIAETIFKEQALSLKIKEGTVECPMTIKWNANYTAESPQAIFVAKV